MVGWYFTQCFIKSLLSQLETTIWVGCLIASLVQHQILLFTNLAKNTNFSMFCKKLVGSTNMRPQYELVAWLPHWCIIKFYFYKVSLSVIKRKKRATQMCSTLKLPFFFGQQMQVASMTAVCRIQIGWMAMASSHNKHQCISCMTLAYYFSIQFLLCNTLGTMNSSYLKMRQVSTRFGWVELSGWPFYESISH